jgi:predicted transcriptional regulator
VWGEGKLFEKPKKLKNLKNFKKIIYLFSFYTVTIYRLYHTHSLGSVEPTIALSESLWSRIVTQNKKKKNKKKKNQKTKNFKNICFCLCVCCIVYVISNTDDEIELNCMR